MVTISHFIHYDILLQNVANITTKCDSCFNTNFDKSLLQNASGVLLQHAALIYKMRRSLQNASLQRAHQNQLRFVCLLNHWKNLKKK